MKYTIFDVETDGLREFVTKIHCLSYKIFEGKKLISQGTITDPHQIPDFLKKQELLVGHNIIDYDLPVIEIVLGYKHLGPIIDTLGISWYQYPYDNKFKHGLKYWGERLGFGKPEVEDWSTQPLHVYVNRCEADVEINTRLFHFQMDYCMKIYEDFDAVMRLFKYLNYKLECLEEQNEGITLDVRACQEHKMNLEFEIDTKLNELSSNMPIELGKVLKTKPKKMVKKDGSLSALGIKWNQYLEEHNLPPETEIVREKPNPGSPSQLKEWLFMLGWQPITFKLSKNTGEKIPQVSLPFGQGLCQSVKDLFEEHPFLEDLDGLYQIQHRYGLFKSYLENEKNGKVISKAHGFTNTLRLAHSKPVVNLPGVDKYYGNEIRGVLTVPDDSYVMCGSDISGLEDNTKQHYIYFFDPDYVKDMRVPGFDPHIDIAVLAEMITKEDEEFFKWYNAQEDDYPFTDEQKKRFKGIKKIRGSAKTVNFSATYGAGPPKIAETLKCDLAFATKLHTTYWNRNKAVKLTAKAVKTKLVETESWIYDSSDFKQKWLYNPISGFWYFLKADKDKFSTLNQGSGVFVFDSWLRKVREKLNPLGIKIIMQYHDELLLVCKKEMKEYVEACLYKAMEENNEQIKLNVKISNSVDWGTNYAECH